MSKHLNEPSELYPRIGNRRRSIVRSYRNYRSHQFAMAAEPKKLIALISRGCHDRTQSSNQSNALSWLSIRGVPHVIVDGMDPEQRPVRNELFGISGIRANYPQFFFQNAEGVISFLGSFDRIEMLNETSGLPPEVLVQHPELETWDKVFGSVVDSFE